MCVYTLAAVTIAILHVDVIQEDARSSKEREFLYGPISGREKYLRDGDGENKGLSSVAFRFSREIVFPLLLSSGSCSFAFNNFELILPSF